MAKKHNVRARETAFLLCALAVSVAGGCRSQRVAGRLSFGRAVGFAESTWNVDMLDAVAPIVTNQSLEPALAILQKTSVAAEQGLRTLLETAYGEMVQNVRVMWIRVVADELTGAEAAIIAASVRDPAGRAAQWYGSVRKRAAVVSLDAWMASGTLVLRRTR